MMMAVLLYTKSYDASSDEHGSLARLLMAVIGYHTQYIHMYIHFCLWWSLCLQSWLDNTHKAARQSHTILLTLEDMNPRIIVPKTKCITFFVVKVNNCREISYFAPCYARRHGQMSADPASRAIYPIRVMISFRPLQCNAWQAAAAAKNPPTNKRRPAKFSPP